MKKKTLVVIFLFFLYSFCYSNIQAQKIYTSNQFKLIFSKALTVERAGEIVRSPIRFSGFYNFSTLVNIDYSKILGASIGAEIKNTGMILKDSTFHTKQRAYTVGIPVYLRIGNMDKRWYAFAGAQYDYLFGYKEKVLSGDSKIKRIGDYSAPVNHFIPSVFAGFHFKSGLSFSLNYMLSNFFSTNYRFKDPTNGNNPLPQGYTNSQIISFAIGFMGDMDRKKAKKKPVKTETQEVYSRNH